MPKFSCPVYIKALLFYLLWKKCLNSVIKVFPLRDNVFVTPPSDTKRHHYYNKVMDKKAIDGFH